MNSGRSLDKRIEIPSDVVVY